MDAYFLPSGVRIDFERIVDASMSANEYPQTYLDTETGILIEVASEAMLERWMREVTDASRYVLVERYPDEERDREALGFIELILKDMAGEYAVQAQVCFEQGGWRALEYYLEHDTEGWVDGWDHFVSDAAGEYVHEWLTSSIDVPITVKFEGCGHCTMCDLMLRDEDGTEEEVKDVLESIATENVMRRVREQMEQFAKRKAKRALGDESGGAEGAAGAE